MTMASVFSGIGGEMIAATMMGWDVEFFCEKNPFGAAVLKYWYPNSKHFQVLLCAQEGRRPQKDGDGLSARSVGVSEKVLRKLRKYGETARASQRLQYQEQLAGELGYTLPALSFDLALATKAIEEEVMSIRSYVRTESLKAYGNAIVPQVMYEIFRAIQITENHG